MHACMHARTLTHTLTHTHTHTHTSPPWTDAWTHRDVHAHARTRSTACRHPTVRSYWTETYTKPNNESMPLSLAQVRLWAVFLLRPVVRPTRVRCFHTPSPTTSPPPPPPPGLLVQPVVQSGAVQLHLIVYSFVETFLEQTFSCLCGMFSCCFPVTLAMPLSRNSWSRIGGPQNRLEHFFVDLDLVYASSAAGSWFPPGLTTCRK